MGLFSNLKTTDMERQDDRLGGGRQLFDTDLYENGVIKMAYMNQSETSKSQQIMFIIDFDGKEYREGTWITNGDGENFYMTGENGKKDKKALLPGYVLIDDLCLIATEKPLNEQDTEEKMVNVWDSDEKKEVPKSRHVLVDLIGKNISAAIQKRLVNKQKKDDNGKYQDTPESREENVVSKFFDPESRMTVSEATKVGEGKSVEPPYFVDQWVEKYKGEVYDARKIKDGGTAGNAGAPQQGAAAQQRTSLFKKN